MHSDIRLENLIFCTDVESAHIIDFDLTGLEGEVYPLQYLTWGIEERHWEARFGSERKKVTIDTLCTMF